ncbi:MAG TPA: RNA polymerase sigma-70 factor [Euzebyales bacterium]|nr:RNA polymerase sigma-70 factor [Euzebyales bacterium]
MHGDTGVFEQHRGLLFGVAYRMLGSVAEAEDVVQEAWLRWQRADRGGVDDPRAYLVRVASHAAIDHLRRASVQRETYVGPWLPEPLLTDDDATGDVEVGEAVSVALLVVLETLSPLERAVFVLHEAFGFTYPEIASALGRSEIAVRQLGHRARAHVHARQPRFHPDRKLRRAVTERFLAAAVGGDLTALLKVLAPDVVLEVDGGGRTIAPRRALHGVDRVARFFVARASAIPAGTQMQLRDVNGVPAALLAVDGVTYAVVTVEPDRGTGKAAVIRLIANPDKLVRLAAPGPAAGD